jgi:hypothetical protein
MTKIPIRSLSYVTANTHTTIADETMFMSVQKHLRHFNTQNFYMISYSEIEFHSLIVGCLFSNKFGNKKQFLLIVIIY